LIFGISYITTADKFALALGLLVSGVVLFAAYIIYALKSKQEPLLDVRMFKIRNFSASVLLIFVFGMISTGTLFILPLYFQHLHEMTPFIAGLILAPQGVGMFLTRSLAAKFSEKAGEKAVLLAGAGATLIGTLPFMFIQPAGYAPLLALLLVRGAGLGILMVPAMSVIYEGLDEKGVAQATTSTRIFQQIGGAFGTALLAIMLSHSMANSGEGNAFFTPFLWASIFTAALVVPTLMLESKKKAI
jgi:MFS family permease